jgi:hypothetical protein
MIVASFCRIDPKLATIMVSGEAGQVRWGLVSWGLASWG